MAARRVFNVKPEVVFAGRVEGQLVVLPAGSADERGITAVHREFERRQRRKGAGLRFFLPVVAALLDIAEVGQLSLDAGERITVGRGDVV